MDFDSALAYFESIGLMVTPGGAILHGKFRYGCIKQTQLIPEEGEPIELEAIKDFTNIDEGVSGLTIGVEFEDDSLFLPRTDVKTRSYSALKRNPQGGFLMPSDIDELRNAWSLVFPDFKSKCWLEETSGFIMLDGSLIGEEGVCEITDRRLTRIVGYVQTKLKALGCTGISPGKEMIRDVFEAEADCNHRNAFLNMMKEKIWDGMPRLDDIFIEVLGGKMPDLTDEESELVLKEVARCWFIGGVARQYNPIQLDIIPILIGDQGIRKSSAVKWMAVKDEFHRAPLNMKEKEFVEQTKGGLVIELAEMFALKGQNSNYLKGFISRSSDVLRMAYDRYSTVNKRHFIMIGTTNEYEFLDDPTGNRRFFPFEVSRDRALISFGPQGFWSDEAKHYIQQVWAEAFARYISKENWTPSAEAIALAKKSQESSRTGMSEFNLLNDYVNELFPKENDKVCKEDLRRILSENAVAYGKDADAIVNIWWKTPNPEWEPQRNQRLKRENRRPWVPEKGTMQKCKRRIHEPGYKPPAVEKVLGQ